jgi:hypothetical protein
MTSDSWGLQVCPRKWPLRRRGREVGRQSRVGHDDGFVGTQLGRRLEERGHDSPGRAKSTQEAAGSIKGRDKRFIKGGESRRGGRVMVN